MRYSSTLRNSFLPGLWILSALTCVSHATTIQDCLNIRYTTSTNASIIADHPTNDGKMLLLYEADTPLDWCSAYHQCQLRESNLVVISESEIQKQMKLLLANASDLNETAWISARRKDYGMGWSWVTLPVVTDCEGEEGGFNCSNSPIDDEEYGRIRNTQTTSLEQIPRWYSCLDELEVGPVSWFEAQNLCYSIDQRLATYEEAKLVGLPNEDLYDGLQYRPWLWIVDDSTRTPMIYSNWSDAHRTLYSSGKACLVINVTNGHWQENLCDAFVRHFICEETIQPSITEAPTADPGELPGGGSNALKLGLGIGLGAGVPVIVAIALGVYYGVYAKKKKKNGSISDKDNGKVNESVDLQNKGGAERTSGGSFNGFPSVANNYMQNDYDGINDAKQSSKNIPPPNTAPPPKPATMGPDPTYALATDPNKPIRLVSSPIGPYSEVEVNQFPTRNAFDDNRGSRIMVDNTMYGGPADQEPKQKPGKFNKPPPGKPKGPEKPPKPGSMTKPQVATVIPIRHTVGPKGDEYAEIQKGDTIKK